MADNLQTLNEKRDQGRSPLMNILTTRDLGITSLGGARFVQQFQIQNLPVLKALPQEGLTILNKPGDRRNGAKSF